MKQTAKAKKPAKQVVVVRKELPTAALWAGAIIAPLLFVTTALDLAINIDKQSVLGVMWSVFICAFTAFYSVDFAKQLRERLKEQGTK